VYFAFRKLADAELKSNIKEVSVYTLPSGQEMEQENILLSAAFNMNITIDHLKQG
jgi:hypothetical protein